MSETRDTLFPESQARSRLRKTGALLLILVVISAASAITYREVLTGDRDRLSGRYDVYRSAGPLAYLMDNRIQNGEFPIWNPLTFCGMPYLANPVTGMLYPVNVARSLLTFDPTPLKSQTGMAIMMALHLVLCGVGMVYLARAHGMSYPAAFAASFIFIFSAIWVRRICEYHFLTMIGWLPWLLLMTRAALRSTDWRRRLALALGSGSIFGCTLLTGAFNMAPYMAVAIAVYGASYRLFHLGQGPGRARMRGLGTLIANDALFGIVLFGIAGLVAMATLLPGAELASLSSRVKGSEHTLMIPHYSGSWRTLYHDLLRYPGIRFEVENIRGAGVAALFLAVAGLASTRRRAALTSITTFLVLFDLSMGPPAPLSRIFYALMPIQMIASTRAFDFALLPFALLAGLGLDAVTARAQRPFWVFLRSAVLLVLGYSLLRDLAPLVGLSFLTTSKWAVILPGAALTIAVAAAWLPGTALWRIALCTLVLGESLIWTSKYVPYLVYADEYAPRASKKFSTEFWSSNRRGLDYFQNRSLYDLRGVMHGYEPVHIERVRDVLSGDSRSRTYQRSVKVYEISEENHRGLLSFKRQFWLARQYAVGPLPGKHDLFPAATTVFLDEPGNLPVPRVERAALNNSAISIDGERRHGRELRFINDEVMGKLREALAPGKTDRTLYLPDASASGIHSALVLVLSINSDVTLRPRFSERGSEDLAYGKITKLRSRGAAEQTIELPVPDFSPLRTRLLFQCAKPGAIIDLKDAYLLQDTQDEGGLLQIVSRTANTVTVDVQPLPDYRILTFLDAYYPGWIARVDGIEAPILRANEAFKAVALSPGPHRVEFVYRPWRVYTGLLVSILTLCGAAVVMLILIRRSRHQGVLS